MSTSLEIVRIPVLSDNYVWLMREPHGDHVGGNMEIKNATGCTIVGNRRDKARIPGIDVEVDDGDR
jgi:hydroxyacylglutathione hydrolase